MNHNRRELFTKFAPAVAIGAMAVPMLMSPAAALAGSSGVTLIDPFRLQDSRTMEADKYDTTAADNLFVEGLEGHQGVLLNITVTQTEDGQSLIESGLKANERVVVDGQYKLQPGSRVAILEGAAAKEAASQSAPLDAIP